VAEIENETCHLGFPPTIPIHESGAGGGGGGGGVGGGGGGGGGGEGLPNVYRLARLSSDGIYCLISRRVYPRVYPLLPSSIDAGCVYG